MNQLPVLPSHVQLKVQHAIVPVVYQEALRALAQCRTIDDGKHWADKADALAAWARIYKNDEAAVEARRLKIHAYRRIGVLAEQLMPTVHGGSDGNGSKAGAASVLKEHGFSQRQTFQIRRIGTIPTRILDVEVNASNPKGINQLAREHTGKLKGNSAAMAKSRMWRLFFANEATSRFSFLLGFCRKNSAYEIARGIAAGEVLAARQKISEMREWLDEFDTSLPKANQ